MSLYPMASARAPGPEIKRKYSMSQKGFDAWCAKYGTNNPTGESLTEAEKIVTAAFEGWFGESIENMDNSEVITRCFYTPLVRMIAFALDKRSKR